MIFQFMREDGTSFGLRYDQDSSEPFALLMFDREGRQTLTMPLTIADARQLQATLQALLGPPGSAT